MAASTVPRYNDRYRQRWVGGSQFDYEENDTNYLPLFSMVGKNFNKNTSPSGFSTNKDRGCKQVHNDFPTSFLTMG
jgi:hypothetical protein